LTVVVEGTCRHLSWVFNWLVDIVYINKLKVIQEEISILH
jgi:hypothetical protein